MLADQVMEPVPATAGLAEQMLVVQVIEMAAGLGQAGAVQRGGGVRIEVRAGITPRRRNSRC